MKLGMDAIGDEYPAVKRCIYMDVANQGLISQTTRRAADAHLDNRLNGNNDEIEMLQLAERTRERFARFIGAAGDEVSITKNASEGLNIIANAIDWTPNDNIVLCPRLEHANNVLPWFGVRDRYGVELRIIEPQSGHIPSAAMAETVDMQTRIVAISTATMIPGFRTDMQPLVKACQAHRAFLIADATQSVGILHTNVRDLEVDGLVVSTVKGLMGFYGLGFLYCRRAWAERFRPAYIARFSVDLGDAPESAPILDGFKLRSGAMRFDIGHYNFPGIAAAHASLGQLETIGTKVIEAKVTRLAAQLAANLVELGLPVCGGAPGPHIGSIVAVGDILNLDGQTAQSEFVGSLHQHLMQNKVTTSVRRGLLRFSLHYYNSDEDIARVSSLVKEWRDARSDN